MIFGKRIEIQAKQSFRLENKSSFKPAQIIVSINIRKK